MARPTAMLSEPASHRRKRTGAAAAIARGCLWLLIIVCGLALRGFGRDLGLSPAVVKYGGSVLWGTMVFFLVSIPASGRSRQQIAWIAASIAVCVELSRLVHSPWLDAFRLTTAGALLLGRVFSTWNLVAYASGILLGAALDRMVGLAWNGKAPELPKSERAGVENDSLR
jgi:uncharacterized protein DUF2809